MKQLLGILVVSLFWCGNVYAASISDLLGNFKSSDLPILQCSIEFSDGSKKTQIYDLEEIERLDPTNDIKDYMTFKKKDGEWTSLNVYDDEYSIRYANINNGFEKGYSTTINRKTGEMEGFYSGPHSVHMSTKDLYYAYLKDTRDKSFNGVCERKGKKNL